VQPNILRQLGICIYNPAERGHAIPKLLVPTYQATQYHNLKDCTSSIVNTLKQNFDLNKIQDRVKVKVNVPLEQATKAQRRSRGIILPLL